MTDPPRPNGTGPGVITPDGCAVDFYAQMAAMGEPAIVHEAIGPGAAVLELGSGTGRITHPLAGLGHPVVAVDESPEMLAHVHGAQTVCARIEDLELGRRFDAVLLASHLINTDDVTTRTALLDACRRHVSDDGCVVVQMHAPAWFETATESESERDGVVFRIRDIGRPARTCCRPPSNTPTGIASGRRPSPPAAWTTRAWPPRSPRPGCGWTAFSRRTGPGSGLCLPASRRPASRTALSVGR